MNNKTPTEIEERFKDIMEKKLNNRFISAGTLIRFRDACFKEGQKQEREKVLKLIDEIENELNYHYKGSDIIEDVYNSKEWIILQMLKSKLSGGNDGKED